MTNNSANLPQLPREIVQDDEIDLLELMRSLWQQRGLILGVALFCALAVLVFHLSKATFAVAQKVEQPISLVFLNAQGKYPNGTVFSPRDIISSRVINAVASEHGIASDVLGRAISIEYSNSLLKEGEEKLAKLLDNAKQPEDIRLATKEALAKLRAETRSAVTISLDLTKAKVPAEEGKQLILEVLNVWSQQVIRRGFMNADIGYPAQAYKLSESSNIIDSFEDLSQYADSLEKSIKALSSLAGAQSLLVKGQSLSDLERELRTLVSADINPLRSFAYSNSAAISAQNDYMLIRVQSRKRLLELEHARLVKLADSYTQALNQLLQSDDAKPTSSGQSQNIGNAQFDQSFFNSLLDLGNKLSNVEIREQLYKKRIETIEKKLNLEKEIDILGGADRGNSDYSAPDIVKMLTETLRGIAQEIGVIQHQLGGFIVAYREQTLSSGSNLYIADAAPQVRGNGIQISKKAGLTLALGLVLGLMLGVMAALIRAAWRK